MADPILPADGKRFSLNYLSRGEPTDDSKRMRARLAALLGPLAGPGDYLGELVLQELGVRVPRPYGYDWDTFLEKAAIRDVLDLVTLALVGMRQQNGVSATAPWLPGVRRIFQEENVRYRVDDHGGVHFTIDDVFERNIGVTIKALDAPRYAAALMNFNASLASLSETPPATKEAIRAVFAANEGLFRLMFPKSPRLAADEVDKVVPLLAKLTAGDPASAGASTKLLRSFREWIDAAHFYRHEAGHEEPKAPPLEITVLLVSAGAGWVRWLAELDRQATG